jgi:ABC-type hemin transport system ATPase subunit
MSVASPARRWTGAAPAVLRFEWVHKSVAAGVPGCSARIRVLSGVKLSVRSGELVAIAGGAGSGKSTLMLCAQGLMRPDLGSVRRSRAELLCLDDAPDLAELARAAARGAAVLAAVRDPTCAIEVGARVFLLRDGRLAPLSAAPVARDRSRRVAERDRRSVDPFARRA